MPFSSAGVRRFSRRAALNNGDSLKKLRESKKGHPWLVKNVVKCELSLRHVSKISAKTETTPLLIHLTKTWKKVLGPPLPRTRTERTIEAASFLPSASESVCGTRRRKSLSVSVHSSVWISSHEEERRNNSGWKVKYSTELSIPDSQWFISWGCRRPEDKATQIRHLTSF